MAGRLSRRQRLQDRPAKAATTRTTQHLDFVSDRIFDPPLTGIYRGRIVKVHERGNTTGMSATFWITDEQSANEIASLSEVRILDGNYLAPTIEQMDQLLNLVQDTVQQT